MLWDLALLPDCGRNHVECERFQGSPRHRSGLRSMEQSLSSGRGARAAACSHARRRSRSWGLSRRHSGISRAKIIFVTVGAFLAPANVETLFATLRIDTLQDRDRAAHAAFESRFFAGRGHAGD